MDETTRLRRTKTYFLKNVEGKSAGVEIDPTPRGIIFSLLGLIGGQKYKKIPNILKILKKNTQARLVLSACHDKPHKPDHPAYIIEFRKRALQLGIEKVR